MQACALHLNRDSLVLACVCVTHGPYLHLLSDTRHGHNTMQCGHKLPPAKLGTQNIGTVHGEHSDSQH